MELKKIHISDIGKIVTGKTPRTSVAENYDGYIPFLTPSDDLSHKSAPKTTKTLTEQGLNEVRNCLLPSRSICVSCIGSDLGKVVMTKEPTVTNQQFNSIIPNKNFNADFVYYFMTLVGRELNYLSKTSTAVPIINKSSFSNYEIEVPDLETQNRIASILSSIDSKIELNRRINDNLEQQAQALFKSWFVDFEPFKDGKFVESELGMIPEGCRVGKAEDFYNINIGKTPPRKEQIWFSSNSSDYTWVSISDLGSCGRFVFTSSEFLTHEAIKRHNIILVPKDTILLSFKLTIGRVGIAGTELTTNEAIARFITSDENREYTYFLLKGYNYEKLGSTSSIATAVNSKIIKAMVVLMPDKEILKAFSSLTKPYFDQILRNEQESIRLTILRDTLLPKLMSGELKINATEVL